MSDKISAWEEWKKSLGDTRPWDLINPASKKISDEDADKRYSVCKSCPQFISITKQCKKCGCFMAAKTKLAEATCPIGKW